MAEDLSWRIAVYPAMESQTASTRTCSNFVTKITRPEQSVLAECEAIVERGMDSFIEVGNALLRIRNERLYDKKPGHAGFATFQEYCEARWNMSRIHAHRMIEVAEVAENLLPIGNTPASESVVRPLAALPPAQQREAWQARG
jgi:hypothetical protein